MTAPGPDHARRTEASSGESSVGLLLGLGALQAVAMLVLFARTKVLAILLGPERAGELRVLDSLLAVFAQTAALSFPFAALSFLPRAWQHGESSFQRLLLGMGRVLLLTSGLAAVVGLGWAGIAPRVLNEDLAHDPWLLSLGFLSVPGLVLLPFVQNAFAARGQPKRSLAYAALQAVLFSISGILGAWLGGLRGLVVGGLIATLVMVVAGWRTLRRRESDQASAPVPSASTPLTASEILGVPRGVWRFAVVLFALAFLAPWVALKVNGIVADVGGRASLGFLAAAVGVALSVRSVIGAAHPVLLTPQMNRGGTVAERLLAADQYQTVLTGLALALVPPVLLWPKLCIHVLYQPEFLPAASSVWVFVIAELLTILAGTYQALIVAEGRLGFHVAQNVAAQALLWGTSFAMVPHWGLAGAGAAAIVGQLLLLTGTLAALRWRGEGVALPPKIGVHVAVLLFLALIGRWGANDASRAWWEHALGVGAWIFCGWLAFLLLPPAAKRRISGRFRGAGSQPDF